MENEFKFRLTRSESDRLARLAKGSAREQINAYFDDSKRTLRRGRAGLRVRIENGKKAFLTLKQDTASTRKGVAKGFHSREEWERSLSLPVAQALVSRRKRIAGVKSPILKRLEKAFPGVATRLKCIGTIRTHRTLIPLAGCRGELDCWKVAGRTFYELEVETSTPARTSKLLRQSFTLLHIPIRPSRTTKLAKLFQLL